MRRSSQTVSNPKEWSRCNATSRYLTGNSGWLSYQTKHHIFLSRERVEEPTSSVSQSQFHNPVEVWPGGTLLKRHSHDIPLSVMTTQHNYSLIAVLPIFRMALTSAHDHTVKKIFAILRVYVTLKIRIFTTFEIRAKKLTRQLATLFLRQRTSLMSEICRRLLPLIVVTYSIIISPIFVLKRLITSYFRSINTTGTRCFLNVILSTRLLFIV